MIFLKTLIEIIFSLALFINALLFIPQIIAILRERSAKGVSLLTFLGFLLIQFAIILHGLMYRDFLLIAGYLLSMVTCGTVVLLVIIYKNRNTPLSFDYLLLDDVFSQLPGHVYIKNKEGIHIWSNTNNWQDSGCKSLADYIGKSDYDLMGKAEADQLRLIDEEVMRAGEMKIAEEYALTQKGKRILYLSHKSPLKNKKGDIIGILGVSLEITEAKKEISDRLNMLENIIAMMPEHVYWIDKEGKYLGCNDIQAKSAGLRFREEIVGLANKDLPWNSRQGALPEEIDKINQQVMITKKPSILEEPAILADGSKAVFISSKVPLINEDNEPYGMVGISVDITQQKKNEEELRTAKEKAESAIIAKTNFTRNMDHSILTPFSGVYGLLEQMEKEETDPVKKEELHVAYLSAKELLTLCQHMLDSMRITSNEDPILEMKLDLKKLLEGLVDLEKAAVHAKNLELLLDYSDDLPTIFLSDAYRLKRIMMNLVDNAIKFTEKGYVKLRVSLAKKLDDKNLIIKISVEDTGIGIAPENHDYIYQSFSRVHPSNTGKYPGLGLGLFTVKHFIEDLGGEIDVISSLEKGSIFICTFPMKRPLLDEIIHKD